MKKVNLIIICLFLFPFSIANALTTGSVHTDSVGNTHYQFSDGTSGYSYHDSVGSTHYQFSDGSYGSSYTDSIGSTHYYFDNSQKNNYVDGICNLPTGFVCVEESQYQEMYNNVLATLPVCNNSAPEAGSFSTPSEYCTPEGRKKIIMEGSNGPWLKMCREHIDTYATAKANYETCIQNENDKWAKYAQAKLDLLKYQIDLQSQKINNSCPADSSLNSTDNCVCNSGFVWNGAQTQCIKCEVGWTNSHYKFVNNKASCVCNSGHNYDSNTDTCKKETVSVKVEPAATDNPQINSEDENNVKAEDGFLKEEKKLSQISNNELQERLSGRILLQVEEKGEAWYINPENKKKYYLGRPVDAFNVMRSLGLGIKHDELEKYLNSKFPSRLAGKIMLDVEQNGEAYYVNPVNLKGYFLNRPEDAFRVMRELGLGISNNDVRKLNVGEVK